MYFASAEYTPQMLKELAEKKFTDYRDALEFAHEWESNEIIVEYGVEVWREDEL